MRALRIVIIALLCAVILFGKMSLGASAEISDNISEQVKYGVGIIRGMGGESYGTAFAIGKKDEPIRYFLTNDHCVVKSNGLLRENLVIYSNNSEKTYDVSVVFQDEKHDFAILKSASDVTDMVPLSIEVNGCKVTEEVYSYGYPGATTEKNSTYYEDFAESTEESTKESPEASDKRVYDASPENIAITKGEVNAKNVKVDSGIIHDDMIRISMFVAKGNSGGPLVNKYGSVVGIIQSKSLADDPEAMTYAVDIQNVVTILDAKEIPYDVRESDPIVPETDKKNMIIAVPIILLICVIAIIMIVHISKSKKKLLPSEAPRRVKKLYGNALDEKTKSYSSIYRLRVCRGSDKKYHKFGDIDCIEESVDYTIGYKAFDIDSAKADLIGIYENQCKFTVKNDTATIENLDDRGQCIIISSKNRTILKKDDRKTVELGENGEFYVIMGHNGEYGIKICRGSNNV